MPARKKTTSAETQKRLDRVVLLARRWARHAEQLSVLASPSYHLLRAVQKLEEHEAWATLPNSDPKEGG